MEWGIGNITTKRSMLNPDKTAIFFNDKPITYKELNDNVNRAADYLKKKGLKKGDRISVMLKNCPEFLEVYFAAAKLGIIFVPLNFRLMGPEIKFQLNNCGSRLLIFHNEYTSIIKTIRKQTQVEEDKFIFLAEENDDRRNLPDWADEYYATRNSCRTDEPVPDEPIRLDDSLAIIYTSGTTGDPKGALLTHGQTYYKNMQNIYYAALREDDIYLSQLPLFHSGGLFVVTTPGLCRGTTIVLRQSFDPEQFVTDIQKYKATIIFALTTMWRFILQTKKLAEVDVSSVRVVMGGGERTPKRLFDDLTENGLYMQQVFGQTENSIMMALPKKDIQRKMGSIGLPGFFTEVWIADKEGNELPHGMVGEIVARGPNVMSGYWNDPEKTAKAIINGILFTGDLGYRDDEGYFYIVDRAKDMYRSGGENVYPAEVEKVLSQHPEIVNIAIIGVPDEKWGESGMAFIIPSKNNTLTKEKILKFLKGKIAKYKFPTHVEFVETIPMTASGKMRKVELKKQHGVILNN